MIKLVSLVEENGLELLKVYDGRKLDVLDMAPFSYTTIKREGYNIENIGWFPINKFITLAEFRDKQINTILE